MDINDRTIIEVSGLFDRSWYAATYHAMLTEHVDPLTHFMEIGADVNCRPNPLFCIDYYREQIGDSAGKNNLLVHYILNGSHLYINPNKLFDSIWYRGQIAQGMLRGPQTLLGHFLHVGRRLGLTANAFFDDAHYLSAYPDVSAAKCDPFYHFEVWGELERRQPSAVVTATSMQTIADYLKISKETIGLTARIIARRPGVSFEALAVEASKKSAQALRPLQRSSNTERQTVLLICHNLGGGVARFVEDRISLFSRNNDVLILTSTSIDFKLSLHTLGGVLELTFPNFDVASLTDYIKEYKVSTTEIHHTYGFNNLRRIVESIDSTLYVFIHDYFLVSPQPHLVDSSGRFVGDDWELHHAVLQNASMVPNPGTIRSWQRSYRWLLKRAHQVIAPSHDVRQRMRKIYPELDIIVSPLERFGISDVVAVSGRTAPKYRPDAPMKIALIGYIQKHKGITVARAVFDLAFRIDQDLSFVIIGYCDDVDGLAPNVRVTGTYADGDLEKILLDESPDLVWYPAQCPETWSYTLTAALRLGLPVLCSNIGAFAERIAGVEHCRIFPWNASPMEWLIGMTSQLDAIARSVAGGMPASNRPRN